MAQAHAQPPRNGTSASSSPTAASVVSWDGDKMLNIYIHDYFMKRGFEKTARELFHEAELDTVSNNPPINAPQGLLYEWWVVFWEIFQAKSNKMGKADAVTYMEHQSRFRAAGARPGIPAGQAMPNGVGQPMPGMQPGQPMHQFMPSVAMGNGVAGPSTAMQQPQQGMPSQAAMMQNRGMPMQGRPTFPAPGMPGQGAPGAAPPLGGMVGQSMGPRPMQPGPGQPGMMPPGQPGSSFPGNARPGSRAGTPAHGGPGMTQASPQQAHMQVQRPQPEPTQQDLGDMMAHINMLPRAHFVPIQNAAGLTEKDDINRLTDEQLRRLYLAYKHVLNSGGAAAQIIRNPSQVRLGPGQPAMMPNGMAMSSTANAAMGMAAGQMMPPGARRPVKRGSNSPGPDGEMYKNEESPPDRKRVRRSPQAGENGAVQQIAPGPPPTNVPHLMNGMMRPGMGPGGQVNGVPPGQHPMAGMGQVPGGVAHPGMAGMHPGMGINPAAMNPGASPANQAYMQQMYRNGLAMHHAQPYARPPGALGPDGAPPQQPQQLQPQPQPQPPNAGTPTLANRAPPQKMGQPGSPSMAHAQKPGGMMPPPAHGVKGEDEQQPTLVPNGLEGAESAPARPASATSAPQPSSGPSYGAPPESANSQRPGTAIGVVSTAPTAPQAAPAVRNVSAPAAPVYSDMLGGDSWNFDDTVGLPDMAFETEFANWITTDDASDMMTGV